MGVVSSRMTPPPSENDVNNIIYSILMKELGLACQTALSTTIIKTLSTGKTGFTLPVQYQRFVETVLSCFKTLLS